MQKEIFLDLQDRFALVDLLNGNPKGNGLSLMVKEYKNLKVRMHLEKNHFLPHVHIDYNKKRHSASYSIEDGKKLAGELDPKYEKTLRAWIEENKTLLLQLWDNLKNSEDHSVVLADLKQI